MDKEAIKNISLNMGISKKEVRQMVKNEINKEVNFKYASKLNNQEYLKPTNKITKRALKVLIEKYVNFVGKEEKEYGDFFLNYQKYYTYTEIKKGSIIRYQFIYSIAHENRKKKELIFEKNRFDLVLSYDFKNRKGLTNEAYVFNYIAGYSYKPYYDNMIGWYYYKEDVRKSKKEGGFKWNAVSEHSKEYDNLKINDYFKLDNRRNEEHVAQRILELNPDHVEMLYKMGFKELYNQRLADEKVEFIKKNAKFLDKNITRKELLKTFKLVKKGMNILSYKEVYNFLEKKMWFYEYGSIIGTHYGEEKLTKTEDIRKIKRMMNLEKEFGEKHLKELRGSCKVLELDFEEIIFKGLKTRESVIKEFKEMQEKVIKERKEKAEKIAREEEEKLKLAKITFEKFMSKNEVIYEKKDDEYIIIKTINSLEIDRLFSIKYENIASLYEEAKKANDFLQKNKIVLKEKGAFYIIETVNEEKVNQSIYKKDPIELYKECQKIVLKQKLKVTPLEEITKKFKALEKEDFIIEPLRTMKDFNDVSEIMELCLLRNEYYDKVKMKQSAIYIAYPKDEKEKYNGEVIEFGIKNSRMEVKQVHGKDNKNTKYYEKIIRIANGLSYEDIIEGVL